MSRNSISPRTDGKKVHIDPNLESFKSTHAYSFADLVYENILNETDVDIEYLKMFCFEDFKKRASKPKKYTLLHETIEGIIFFYLDYSTRKFPDSETPYYQSILTEAEIKIPRWLTPDSVRKHTRQLDRLLERAIGEITPSIFYLLFSDRKFLALFQTRMARLVSQLKHTDHPDLLAADGILKRPKYLPTWLKAGVFHRDRGRCQHCWRDLTGVIAPVTDRHLDHIIPLAESGTNDPTNFQLSCQSCNLKKGKKIISTSHKYTPFW